MENFIIPELKNVPLFFRSRPESLPGEFRPLWRVGIILLILHISSRGMKSSFARLHVLGWTIRSKENQDVLLKQVNKNLINPDEAIVRIEPSLNRAVNFACAEKLTELVDDDHIQLTTKGSKIATILEKDDNIFLNEKIFLKNIDKKVTEQLTKTLFNQY